MFLIFLFYLNILSNLPAKTEINSIVDLNSQAYQRMNNLISQMTSKEDIFKIIINKPLFFFN